MPADLPLSLRSLTLDGSGFRAPGPPSDPPSHLRLGGLTRLETLTLLGCCARILEDESLGECEQPPLPPSLRTLRLESSARWPQRVKLSRHRPSRLSASPDLMLEASVGQVDCGIGLRDDGEVGNMAHGFGAQQAEAGAPQLTSLLPAGARTLSIELGALLISDARLPATLDPDAVCEDDALRSLCELFGSAPDSYREFRLSSRGGPRRALRMHLTWFSVVLGRPAVKTFRPENMASFANALLQFAPAYGVNVSLSADESCCVIRQPA